MGSARKSEVTALYYNLQKRNTSSKSSKGNGTPAGKITFSHRQLNRTGLINKTTTLKKAKTHDQQFN